MEQKANTEKKMNWRGLSKLIRDTNPSKPLVALAIALSMIGTVAGLIVPFFTKNLVDQLSGSSLSSGVITLLIAAFVVQAIFSGLSMYLLLYIGETVVARLRERLMKKVLSLQITYFDSNRVGDTTSRIVNDTGVIKDLVSNHLISLLTSTLSIVGSIGILLYLDWKLTAILLAVVPIMMIGIRFIGKRMYKVSKGLQEETAKFTATITQVLSEVRLVKFSMAENVEEENGKNGIKNVFSYSMKEAKIYALLMPLMTLLLMGVLVVIVGYGGVRVSTGELSAGELVAFLLYLFQIIIPFSSMARFLTAIQKAMGATERLQFLLDHDSEERLSGDEVEDPAKMLSFHNVEFSYGKELVLKKASFEVPPGKITAIVGPSGSGKTTTFSLIERFYQPQKGEIALGGKNIHEFSLVSWRKQIGYVSQESPLIAGTIKENIVYGLEEDVSDEKIEEAAKQAYALPFIQDLPNGFETEIGERGIKLSGGQRQRIAIARAIVRNPYILLLDEATSSLDSTSEVQVQRALNNLMKGRTTIVIAHRLSTVVHADQILVMENGIVSDQGTHEELYMTSRLYKELAQQQFQIEESL
ncbi:ABC transporter ATP-binding protein [Alkalihalobacillus hwajinpoensis]|uniref:ABC transporter ATP-binding protein n=1 Tax=Guptibacillus hwajinpoensis TaxID=208199 RepID=UPI00188488A3|nr:ABC transporter ATP-binding protein [Pseudalkalibacillus hwajinpoensis]MBF0705760.1 ABC transporter ATP-binding protein [Pseudalkalibacillus hwajinpoensis]